MVVSSLVLQVLKTIKDLYVILESELGKEKRIAHMLYIQFMNMQNKDLACWLVGGFVVVVVVVIVVVVGGGWGQVVVVGGVMVGGVS